MHKCKFCLNFYTGVRNSNSVKKEQSQSINPDTIKCTDVRSLNGWDASIQPYIPVELRNQWLSCVTTSPYDGANSEALCQLLISADKAIHASRRMDNNGNWLPWKVSDLSGKADISMLPKTVHTSITGTGSDYYDISCPGIKYGAAVIVQFASQRNEYYILNADAMADNTVRIRVNKAVPAGTGIYVNAIYSVN